MSGYGTARSINEKNDVIHLQDYSVTIKITLKRYIALLLDFWFVFILAQITSFLGHSQMEIYGSGAKAIVYFFIDFFGFANLYGTPTLNPTWWYMTLAFTIIVIMPFILDLYHRKGVLVVFLSLFLPRLLQLNFSIIFWYLPALVFGVWCAKERIFEKIKMIHIVPGYIGNKIIKLFILSIVLVCLYYLRNTFGEWLELWDMIIASAITYFCFEFISSTSFVSHVLKIIGKHSMNMFLTHTFIFLIYLKSFTYSFHNFLLIIIVLIVDTLLLSILIEKIKTWTHFNMLKNKIIKYILKTKVK